MARARRGRSGPAEKSKIGKAGAKILQELVNTEKPFEEIAKAHGVFPGQVRYLNGLYEIRSKALIDSIAEKNKPGPSRKLRKNSFTRKQKDTILRASMGGFVSIAKERWKDPIVRKHYSGQFEWFLFEMMEFAAGRLDLYDPAARGKGGRKTTPFGWLMKNARFFCKGICYRDGGSAKKAKIIREEDVTRTILEEMSPTGLKWVPTNTRLFLEKMGLKIREVARLGFADIEQELVKVIESEEAGLSNEEQLLAKQKLAGKANSELAKSRGVTNQAIDYRVRVIARKINQALLARSGKGTRP